MNDMRQERHRGRMKKGGRDCRKGWAFLLPIIFMMMPIILMGQTDPIAVTLSILPPYASDLTIWESNPNKVLIRLQNRTAQSFDVRLSGFAENLNGSVRIVTKDGYPRNRITVGPNSIVNLNLNDLQLFTADAVDIVGAEKNTIARTKQLPEGSYRMCVRALEFTTLAPLSASQPSGCANFVVRLAEPPRPLLPLCGTTVKSTNPQLVNFQWSVPAGISASTRYEFELVEVPKGRNPNDAILTKTTPIFFTRTLSAPILSYGPGDPPLQIGQEYAWRVRAVDPTGSVTFRNDGYSDVCSFVYGKVTPLISNGPGISIGRGTGTITTDSTRITPINLTDDGTGIRVRDLGSLQDLFVPSCITLTPKTVKATASWNSLPLFALEVQPGINPDAISGGKIEIWEESITIKPTRLFDEKGTRPSFQAEFSGHGPGAFRHTRYGPSLSNLDLTFINHEGAANTFRPESGKSYRWRVTLNYNGRTIRADGTECRTSETASPFGKIPGSFTTPDRPDTLVAAGFNIVVEAWDASSKSVDASRPSGIGRIRFNCQAGPTIFTPIPFGPGNLKLKQFGFDVVGSISDSTTELSLPEARSIDESSRLGDRVTLLLPDRAVMTGSGGASGGTSGGGGTLITSEKITGPVRNEFIIDRNLLIDRFGKVKVDGIRVAFRDVTWSGPVQPKVILTDGIAVYPSPTPVPTVPAELNLDDGFRLDIDSLTIIPSEARVEGNLKLPPSIISTEACTFATLPVPETKITPYCEFYIESDSAFGEWAIGETGLLIHGEKYVIDFSSTKSPSGMVPAVTNNWKGVMLDHGGRSEATTEVVSNRGYVQAAYAFSKAWIVANGFGGRLTMERPFTYLALDPFGYRLSLNTGYLQLAASAIDTGEFFNNTIRLPQYAVNDLTGGYVQSQAARLAVQKDMDLYGAVGLSSSLAWGNKVPGRPNGRYYSLSNAADSGRFWLSSHWQKKDFYPVNDTTFATPFLGMPETKLEEQKMQGVTLVNLHDRDFTIHTPDIPNPSAPIVFPKTTIAIQWMNVGLHGVHTEILIRPKADAPGPIEVGPTYASYYLGDSIPFKIQFADFGAGSLGNTSLTHIDPKLTDGRGFMRMQFVESAVWSSNLSGGVFLEGPIGMPLIFRDMMFTSIANNAGGRVEFAGDDTLDYWGLEMVERDTNASAGVMAVKMGVIYMTAAGMAERRHFAEPFWLVWGEMKSSGNFGQLFFDYNNVGQQFDGFGYATEFLALSPYTTTGPDADRGYIQTYGSLSVPFFGAKMMSISDAKNPDNLGDPFNGRSVRVWKDPHFGAGESELKWAKSWAGGLADLDFTMMYDTIKQDGFVGTGSVAMLPFGDGMDAVLHMSSSSSCFRVIETSQRGFDLGPVASMGQIAEIWGCGCIEDGTLKQIAVGGYLSHSAGSTILQARTGTSSTVVFGITPDRFTMLANGQMFINVGGNDIDAFGLTHFTLDWANGFAEGYFRGTVSLGAVVGIPVAAGANAGISGFGEFDWHAGLDYQSIQGRVGVAMYGMVGGLGVTVGTGTSIETGIFLGINTPKNKAWVMDGINGKFGLNKGGLPNRLTGFYAYLGIKQGIDLFIVSGGYEAYVGIGLFAPTVDVPTGGIFGNFGIYIWGKILGGLVSAAAWGNLQLGVAIPPSFEGSVGLEACVLWVICGSVDIHVGFNKDDGFYMY